MKNKLLYPYKLVGAHDLITYSFLVLRKSIQNNDIDKYNELIEEFKEISIELNDLSIKSYWDLQPPFVVFEQIEMYEYNYPARKYDIELKGKTIDNDSIFNPQINELHYIHENNPLYPLKNGVAIFEELLIKSNNFELWKKISILFDRFEDLAYENGHKDVSTNNNRVKCNISPREMLFLSQNYIYYVYSTFKDKSIELNSESILKYSHNYLLLIDKNFEIIDYSMLYDAGFITIKLNNQIVIVMAGSGQIFENKIIDKHAVKEWYNNIIGNAIGKNYYYEEAFLYVQKIVKQFPEENILLTGHSKGGGAAIYAGKGIEKPILSVTFDASYNSRITEKRKQFERENNYYCNQEQFSLNFVELVTVNAANINLFSKSTYKMHILNWLNPTYCEYIE